MTVLSRKQKLFGEHSVSEILVSRLSHDGRGIGEIDGKITFIFGGLPNEKVAFQYTSVKKRMDEGKALHVAVASPDRVKPVCPHFGICGGCQLQHLDPIAQRAHKQAVMLEQLYHLCGVIPDEVLAPLVGPTVGYRHKARLGVRFVEKKNKLLIGFREQQANKIADLSQCLILVPEIGYLIESLRVLIAGLIAFDSIAQIEVSVGTGAEEVGLVFRNLVPVGDSDLAMLKAFAIEKNICLFLQPKGPDSIHCIWPNTDKRYLKYSLAPYGLEFEFRPSDFTQINHDINLQMVARALDLLEPTSTDRVLDLFCGIGNFSLPLAQRAAHVVGVEGHIESVEGAKHNAVRNGIHNVSFYAQDLTQPLSQSWAAEKYDLVLIDPPRSGALDMMPHIEAWGARKVLYISCQPATMARDAAILIQKGYRLVKAGIMDMFPHTAHVETVALFQK